MPDRDPVDRREMLLIGRDVGAALGVVAVDSDDDLAHLHAQCMRDHCVPASWKAAPRL